MGWRQGEIWLDVDLLWFRESGDARTAVFAANAPSFARLTPAALAAAIPDGLSASRRRRAELQRRRDARKTRTAAIVIGPAVVLALAAPRLGSASRTGDVLAQDPPSQTLDARPKPKPTPRTVEPGPSFPAIRWNRARSSGLPYAGSLANGTQLPLAGPDWVTWNPVADRVPNAPHRLHGNEHAIRKLVAVLAAYRGGSPGAPLVVVGDISFTGGGPMELHRSHQNGLDVDVYYPRRDERLLAPTRSSHVDLELAQELLDHFVAVGVEKVFVGYGMGLRGPSDVVTPYPNHQDHMHVRFRRP